MEKQKTNKWLSGLIFGALLGGGIALLTASRSGEETRDMIAEKSNQLRDKAVAAAMNTKGKIEELTTDVIDSTRERVNKLKADGLRIKMSEAEVI
jgi:gas vesicle protein